MISNMAAYGLARQLRPVPIYEALLEQDGIDLRPAKPITASADTLSLERVEIDRGLMFTSAQDAAHLLAAAQRGGRQEVFPVIDSSQHLVGIITLEDLAVLASEPDAGELVLAADIMRPPVYLERHQLASAALDLMSSQGLREIPVVDPQRHVLGLIDEAAIAREYMRVRALERIDPRASGIHGRIVGP
jgi:CBS domain-containing protein